MDNRDMNEELNNQARLARGKLLILKGSQKELTGNLFGHLNETYELLLSSEPRDMLNEGRLGDCEWALIDPALLTNFDERTTGRQAIEILNHIGEGVCIVNGDGMTLWANHKMEEFGASIKESVSKKSREACEYFIRTRAGQESGGDNLRSRKYSFTEEDTHRYFEMCVSPIHDANSRIARVATIIWEATASQRLQKRINAIDKAGSELVRIEAETIRHLNVEQRISLLQDKIVRYARELLHFDKFSIRLLNRSNNQLELLFGVGVHPGDLEIFANIENNGIIGYVAASGRSYICNNPLCDPHFMPGLDSGACSLTVPLRLHDKVIGSLNVQSEKSNAFSEEDRQVAEIFARYIAIAMNILELMVVERHQIAGQAAEDINRALSGPLGTILTEVTFIQEEYIGHDDIRRRLQIVIDSADQIKKAIRELKNAPKGIVDLRGSEPVQADPRFSGKRILVVDDEEFIRQTIVDVVREKGCEADYACDGKQAIEKLKAGRYDLVISDIKMPYATGYDVFAAARQIDSSMGVILMTGFGYDPNHSIVRANREGLNAVLYKPFKVDQLLKDVIDALESRNLTN